MSLPCSPPPSDVRLSHRSPPSRAESSQAIPPRLPKPSRPVPPRFPPYLPDNTHLAISSQPRAARHDQPCRTTSLPYPPDFSGQRLSHQPGTTNRDFSTPAATPRRRIEPPRVHPTVLANPRPRHPSPAASARQAAPVLPRPRRYPTDCARHSSAIRDHPTHADYSRPTDSLLAMPIRLRLVNTRRHTPALPDHPGLGSTHHGPPTSQSEPSRVPSHLPDCPTRPPPRPIGPSRDLPQHTKRPLHRCGRASWVV